MSELISHGIQISEIYTEKPDLEAVFVDMINKSSEKNGLLELLACWKDGTIYDELEDDYSDLTDEEVEMMKYYNKVMETDRNVGMADAAENYIKQGMSVFFVVGAAHMCGDDGVVALLQSRGYNVQPVR